jgi:hypothetical protein
LEYDSGRYIERLSDLAHANIGQKSQNSPESSYRAGKHQWACYSPEDATWEHEDVNYPK